MEKNSTKPMTGYASIDKPWLKFYEDGVDNFTIPDKSMYQLMEEETRSYDDKTAITYFDKKINYQEYKRCIREYAQGLAALGIQKKDFVLFVLPQIPETRELIYATNILGAVVFPITPMIAPKQLDRFLSENEIQSVFIFEDFYERYESVLKENENVKNIIPLNGTESLSKLLSGIKKMTDLISRKKKIQYHSKLILWSSFVELAKNSKLQLTPVYEKNTVAAVVATSGTSGIPSGVMMTNEQINAMALQHLYGTLNYQVGDKNLDDLIPSIAYGFSVMHYSSVLGVNSILVPNMETDVKKLMDKHQPDHFIGGPIHYEILKRRYDNGEGLPKKGKNFVSGGATIDKEIEKMLNSITDDEYVEDIMGEQLFIRQGYGCTENGGAATYAKIGSYALGSVGIPLPYEIMSVFKPDTDEELSYNTVGEICISGPTVMEGYLNNPELTNQVKILHKDGRVWLHTKDLGYCDENGRFFIQDRIKNIFMRTGHNVHPKVIKSYLLSLDFIEDCCVVGVKHPEQQQVPVAFIKLKEGISMQDVKEQIKLLCIENLDEPSVPYEFIFVDNMPHNMGGKIDERYLLRASGIDYTKDSKTQDRVLQLKKVDFEI